MRLTNGQFTAILEKTELCKALMACGKFLPSDITSWDIEIELRRALPMKVLSSAPFLGDVLPENCDFIKKCDEVFGVAASVRMFDTAIILPYCRYLEDDVNSVMQITRWPELLEQTQYTIDSCDWVMYAKSCPRGAASYTTQEMYAARNEQRLNVSCTTEDDWNLTHYVVRDIKEQMLFVDIIDQYLTPIIKKGFHGFAAYGIVPVKLEPGWSAKAIVFYMHNSLSPEVIKALLERHQNETNPDADPQLWNCFATEKQEPESEADKPAKRQTRTFKRR